MSGITRDDTAADEPESYTDRFVPLVASTQDENPSPAPEPGSGPSAAALVEGGTIVIDGLHPLDMPDVFTMATDD